MRCLVTGGAGFIGSHVADVLADAGHGVRIFDLCRSRHAPEADHFIGSILDLEALREAMNGVEAVFHLAAVADVRDVFSDPLYAESVNVRGTVNILEAARRAGVARVLYGSTTWVYSEAPNETVDEETPIPPPRHLYTATKLAGEHYCRAYAELYGLHTTILRYGIPYGPRARDGAVIPAFVKRARSWEPIHISGDGSQYRQFVYVRDLACGNVAALANETPGRIFNLDGEKKISIRQIAEAVKQIVGGAEIEYGPPRPGDFGGKTALSLRARTELGWRPETPFGEGLDAYIHWLDETERPAEMAP